MPVGSLQRYGGRIGSLSRAIVSALSGVFGGAAAVYSVRIPSGSTYIGALLRVRRSSDNAEQDFGAVAAPDTNGDRWLEDTALLAFVGAGNSGFVTTWYDQSGNGRHATNATAASQPRIVNAGVLETVNGRPGLFPNISGRLITTASFSAPGVVAVAGPAAMPASTAPGILGAVGRRGDNVLITAGWGGGNRLSGNTGLISGAWFNGAPVSSLPAYRDWATGADYNAAQANVVAHNHSTATSWPSTIALLTDPFDVNARGWRGVIPEIVIFPAQMGDAQRQSLERSQGVAYRMTPAAQPAAFYSTRIPPFSLYTGPLVRVRRSSDNAAQDFGAVANGDLNGNRFLDTAAVLAFVGAGNSGFIVTWYDQSGNGRNMTQATAAAQPRIVNAGVLETSGGRPAIWTAAGLSMNTGVSTWLVTGNADRALNAVVNRQSGGTMAVWSGQHSANGAWGVDVGSPTFFAPYTYGLGDATSAGVAANTISVITATRSAGVSTGFYNGNARATNSQAINTIATNGLGIGVRPDAAVSTGWYSEIGYYPNALTVADRQAIERSQGTAFGITVA